MIKVRSDGMIEGGGDDGELDFIVVIYSDVYGREGKGARVVLRVFIATSKTHVLFDTEQ